MGRGRAANARRRLRALEAYADARSGSAAPSSPRPSASDASSCALEPYRESGYRILIEALAREGNGAEAILVYEELRTRLREELGITPSDRTQEAYRRLLR